MQVAPIAVKYAACRQVLPVQADEKYDLQSLAVVLTAFTP